MHLGIIKIVYNRKEMHFMDDRLVNLGEEEYLTALTIWWFWISDCKYVLLLVFGIDFF